MTRRAPALLVTAALVLAGCGATAPAAPPAPSPSPSESPLLTYDQYVAEYSARKGKLSFPPDYSTRMRVDQRPSADAQERWERGAGAVTAVTEWNCAWGARWVTADAPHKPEALTAFAELAQTAEFKDFSTDAKELHLKLVSQAKTGDDALVRQFATANCPELLKAAGR